MRCDCDVCSDCDNSADCCCDSEWLPDCNVDVCSETLIDSESINALSDSDNDVDTDAEARLESPLLNDAEVLSDTCLSCNALAESDDDFEVDADVLLETSPLIDAESLNDAFSEAN